MTEQSNSCGKQLLVVRVDRPLKREQRAALQQAYEAIAAKIGSVAAIEEPGVALRVEPSQQTLMDALTANTEALSALAQAINRQADAIADLVNSAFDHDDDDDEGGDTYL